MLRSQPETLACVSHPEMLFPWQTVHVDFVHVDLVHVDFVHVDFVLVLGLLCTLCEEWPCPC